jgi:BirA family transcriptional regulator, biotin operon repressor / biotin---[acetyl-CoA-carboxylase] ligase
MAGLDEWQSRGPRRVAERFLARLVDEAETPGLRRGIDPGTGDLVLERDGRRTVRSLAEALA